MPTAKIQTARPTTGDLVIRLIFGWRRFKRLYFPSPAEVRFVRIMRGHALAIPFIKDSRTGFPLTIVRRGRLLKNELVEREVWAGRYCIDFAVQTPYRKKGIEIDGSHWHMNVVKDMERDDYLQARGWQVKRIPASRLVREPRLVYGEVVRFLKS